MPKESLECVCLSLILLDSVYKKNKYYPRVILKECNYIIKEKKNSIKTFITNNVDIFSDDSDEEILKKIQMEKKICLWRQFRWRNFEKNSGEEKFWWRKLNIVFF